MMKVPRKLIWAFIMMYGYAILFWIVEAANPGITKKFVAGAPLPVWYTCIIGMLVWNVIIAWIQSS